MMKSIYVQTIRYASGIVIFVMSLTIHSFFLSGCGIYGSDPVQGYFEESMPYTEADQNIMEDEFERAVEESQKIAQRKEFLTRIADLYASQGDRVWLSELVNEKHLEKQQQSIDALEQTLCDTLQALQKNPESFFQNSKYSEYKDQPENEKDEEFFKFKEMREFEMLIRDYSFQKKKLDALKQSNEERLSQLEYRKKEVEREILEMDKRQRELFEKNQNSISGQRAELFYDEQRWNHEAVIDSGTVLPDIGSAREGSLFEQACLSVEGFMEVTDWNDEGLLLPARGILSAGTWNYPSGGLHLGMDLALPIGTPLQAPCDGIILYADDPVESNCGYLGNWCGWPYGGGNTICMLGVANGKLYAFSFFHLSKGIPVYPGMNVRAGDMLARSGNSGNSSGPHTHIEAFELFCSREEAISYFTAKADFSFGTGWQTPGGSSEIARRIRAEKLFGIG